MDSLSNVLASRAPHEPQEIAAIKAYVAEQFGRPVRVGVSGEQLIITAPSAAFANALRLRVVALQEVAGTNKRIIFRIG